MPTRAEYEAAWNRARVEYEKTGRRPIKVRMSSVPTSVKSAARSALAVGGLSTEADVTLRRLAHQEKVSATVVRRALEHCSHIEPVVAWAKVAAAGLPQQPRLQTKSTPSFNDGIMICLKPDPTTAAKLALPDGIEPANLHVTLAYLGKVDQNGNDKGRFEDVEQAVRLYAQIAAPLTGEVAGVGEFKDDGDGAPLIALVDLPGLNGWREALMLNVVRAGADVAENHGYTPHMTLGYGMSRDTVIGSIAGTPLSFSDVWLVWGEQWLRYPLEGDFTGSLDQQVAGLYPPEEKTVRHVRTVEGMRLYDLPMGAIIVRDLPSAPAAPYVDPTGKKPTSADKTGDSAAAKAIVKTIEQRIAEGVDPAEAAVAYKKELHATRLRIQRARRKQEQLAAAAAAKDQTLDAGSTVKDISSDEIVAAATTGDLMNFMVKPGAKARALYGAPALDDWVGDPGSEGVYSAEQFAKFENGSGPGFVAQNTPFYDVLQHDTEPDEYLPVLHVAVGGPSGSTMAHHVQSGWAIRRDGITYLIESGDAADDGSPSDAVKQRLTQTVATYQKVLAAMPADKRPLQRGVALVNAPNPMDAYWAAKYNMPGFQSFATGGNGGTQFWNGNDAAPAQVAHEFGHNLDNSYDWMSSNPSWAAAVGSDEASSSFLLTAGFTATRAKTEHPLTFGTNGVTDYGQTHVREDYAESVRLYLKDKREGKIGYIAPTDGAAKGLNIRFADAFPERARLLDQAFGMSTDYDTEFHKKQVTKLETFIGADLKNADMDSYGLAAKYGLREPDVVETVTRLSQKKFKMVQYDVLTADVIYAMQAGIVPAGLKDFDALSAINAFTGGKNDQNNLLTESDLLSVYSKSDVAYQEWQAKYSAAKQEILEKHLALAKVSPTDYLGGNGLYADTTSDELSSSDRVDMANALHDAAKGFAFEHALKDAIDTAPPGTNEWSDEQRQAYAYAFATGPALNAFASEDDDTSNWTATIANALKAKSEADAAQAAKDALDAGPVDKMSLEEAQAQAAAMSINDLPDDVAQKIRKRKAFVKYKAKQPQKITTTAAEFWKDENPSGPVTFQVGGGYPTEHFIDKLNAAYAGKTVTMKTPPGVMKPSHLPSGAFVVDGFEAAESSYAGGTPVLYAYYFTNSSGTEKKRIPLNRIGSITHEGPGLSPTEAQKLAEEYEAKATQEALVAHLLGHVVSVTGGAVEASDPTRFRPFKEGSRRKGNVWLKQAGVEPKDKLVAMELGVGNTNYHVEQAKINLAANISAKIDTAENWDVFRKYAEEYGIASGHDTNSRTKQTLKSYDEYSAADRQRLYYGEVAYRIRRWASTSGDTMLGPLMMQKAAQLEFGLNSDYKARLEHSTSSYDVQNREKLIEAVEKVYERVGPWFQTFLRAAYDNTQASFQEAGITHVSLYRGMGKPTNQDWPPGSMVERVYLQPMNSWSTSRKTANQFGSGKQSGRVLAVEVPIERVIGSARTGFGCLNESEFVVLDTPGPVKIMQ